MNNKQRMRQRRDSYSFISLERRQAFLCIVCICCFLGYDTRHVLVIVFLSLYLSAANILLNTYLEIDQKRYNVQDQRPQPKLH